MPFAKTGPDGRFSIGKPSGPYLLAATSDDGSAEAAPQGLAKSDTLALEAWGKIKGEARIGRRPAPNQIIDPDPRQNDRFAGSLDKDGRFRVDDVAPGHYELTVTIDPPPASDRPGPVNELGRVKVPVDIPEGADDVPVDLGEIDAEVKGG